MVDVFDAISAHKAAWDRLAEVQQQGRFRSLARWFESGPPETTGVSSPTGRWSVACDTGDVDKQIHATIDTVLP
jgi:hypothetical protein